MSSRAIRKLQKLREQELQQAEQEEDDSGDDEPVTRPSQPKINAFDLLNAAGDDDDEDEDEDQDRDENDNEEVVTQPSEPAPAPVTKPVESSNKKRNKKKKKKGPSKPPASEEVEPIKPGDAGLDDIDRALRELAVDKQASSQGDGTSTVTGHDRDYSFPKTPGELLSIEPKSLNAMTEMRKLFGNVVLENFDQPQDSGTGRRRERNRETVDLGQALTGRYSPASRGQSLAGVTLRRNVLMQGKDEWPRAPSGGLGMELVEKPSVGPAQYRMLHNASYQDVQRQFEICVESMDPQRLIHLLQYNPYHISTLLQVSDIAKHQGDHAVSADLLERALFNIGRSVHSSFANRLKEGQARLDFAHAENREFWLVGWRYMANLGMKGTWRTAYEWAKLLLSLNTEDPYCIRLLIDHLALRGREYSHFIELCTQTRFSRDWEAFPNIQCSLALAYLRVNKPKECREQLSRAMSRYPWVFCKIAQALDIQPMPKSIWGKMPPTESHELLTELYIARAKDLWNTPEAVSLIMEVSDTLAEKEEPIEPPEITLDIARHVVLSDIPSVTTHLPGRFVSGRISSSDPLPPYESEAHQQQSDPTPSYLSRLPEAGRPQWLRDLLGQMDNGAINFPLFQRGGDEEGELGEGDNDGTTEGDNRPPEPAHPSANEQALLEQWLLSDGLQALEAFIHQYGVDRGNWGDVIDYSPLSEYLDALEDLPEPTRQRLLHGQIRDALGEMVIDMLEDELQVPEDDEDV